MALIKCKECGKEISNKAKNCVHCGWELDIAFCPECEKEISKNDIACKYCGFQLNAPKIQNQNTLGNSKRDTFSLVGMILGICAILAWLIPLIGYPCTILGIIFSSCGLNSNKKNMSVAGLVLSIIFLILTLINSIIGALIGSI